MVPTNRRISMPPRLELFVAILELVAFFLVTPEVIGRSRLEALFERMGRLNDWFRSVWFDREFGPVPPSSAMVLAIIVSFGLAALLGFDAKTGESLMFATITAIVVGPVLFVGFYLFLRTLHRRAKLGRLLAVVGACLFVAGRLIVMASAYSRITN